ncbi:MULTISPECIES: pyridoxamine 5'-phosphate oxidase family protein [Eubacterium]|uniref:Pyridoxamine 5'-phosphate oxidase family protein n=1 Tax=Eubacterium maltosivorans TaxID=2041044 RepID=A0A4P9C789_EUBML|nr:MULTISPECIES: pyridoxamine 5'-phosphate oxidase family protein [Eubacterium]QCT70571.1 pyridoxamine 5'-phosphate oxidase family protein [Eubacterium maltosivorans]
MKIQEDIKKVIEGSAFVVIDTVGENNLPHPIIAGKGEVGDETITFGIYKMEVTQKNLLSNPKAWVLAATMDGGPKGYRLEGTAKAEDKQLIFTPEKAEELL